MSSTVTILVMFCVVALTWAAVWTVYFLMSSDRDVIRSHRAHIHVVRTGRGAD